MQALLTLQPCELHGIRMVAACFDGSLLNHVFVITISGPLFYPRRVLLTPKNSAVRLVYCCKEKGREASVPRSLRNLGESK